MFILHSFPSRLPSFSRSTFKTFGKASSVLAFGTIAHVVHSNLALPLFTMGCSMIAATLAIKAVGHYDRYSVNQLKTNALDFHRKYPTIRAITLIFIWIFCNIAVTICCGTAFILGIYTGVLLKAEMRKKNQKINTNDTIKDLT